MPKFQAREALPAGQVSPAKWGRVPGTGAHLDPSRSCPGTWGVKSARPVK